jgi:hypothetical protein
LGCFLGLLIRLVGVEHQTPLWRIKRTFSFAAPAHGRAAEAYGTDVVSRASRGQAPGCIYEALLVAVEDQRPPADATCHVAQYHRGSSHMVSEPSLVSHRSQRIRASRRVTSALRASAARAVPQTSRTLVARLGESPGLCVEPTLG